MSETLRTVGYVAVAGALLGLAFAMQPRPPAPLSEDEAGAFFASWKDPLAPTSLEVVEYDEDTGTVHPFKVAQVEGKWSIPSHSNYPTDAERQLAEAAATVYDLQKLSMVSNDKSTHEEYGVVDPDPATLKGGDKGVGKRVVLEDKQGKKLAQLIIGKEDKGQAGIRFVRVPGQDAVYRAEIKPEKLTTKFENWIEKDLLKLNTWDIKDIVLNNYSLDEAAGRIVPGDVLDLKYDGDASKWTLKDLKEGEELNPEKLNGMRDALDNLKIVDVRRKPEGLGRELRQAEGIQLDREAMQSLASKGFFVFQGNLISNEGEAIAKMKDGVVYVLRFGEIAVNTGGPAEKGEAAAEEGADKLEAAKPEVAAGANRYIFVMAQFDEKQIPQPDLKLLPGETQPAPAENKTSQTGAATDDAKLLAQAAIADDKAAKAADAAKDETKKDDAKPEGEKPEEPKSKNDMDRERKEIEKENKRKQDEYNDKVKKGQDRVKELNDRFADWYYVISDAEYKKIHLSRADIIKAKEGATTEDKSGVETFNKLKTEGLKE